MDATNPKSKRSLISLIGDVPTLVADLVRVEIERFKAELAEKGQKIGFGVALLAAAAVFLLFGLGVIVACAVLALTLALPGWLAALIVAAVLFLIAALLVVWGRDRIKQGVSPVEDGTTASIRRDLDAFKGEGEYDRH
ncbi:phage holin family protein [Luethyella okanaganae]|uniref:Phage holin family protein n=1 Tax=Luethyella okanaganae TaxID=69372 RepID=A0ABW1VHQ4_9MICO